jgi:hypothetical protein
MAGYIGNFPTPVPLTSADITDGIITSAKIADGAIVNDDINASAGVVFSKLASTGTLTVDNIQFPATAVASANANNLDDYEEGTWTPTFTSGGNTLTITGGTQTYRYTKIGRQVFIEFNIENSTVSGTAATGDQRITLPFTGTSGAVRNPSSLISFYTSGGLRFTGADVLYGEIGTSSTFIQLQEWVTTSGYRNISVAPTTGSGTYFWFNITYTTDA